MPRLPLKVLECLECLMLRIYKGLWGCMCVYIYTCIYSTPCTAAKVSIHTPISIRIEYYIHLYRVILFAYSHINSSSPLQSVQATQSFISNHIHSGTLRFLMFPRIPFGFKLLYSVLSLSRALQRSLENA